MSNKKVCGTCINAKFRSDAFALEENENIYLVCQCIDKVVDFNNTCTTHKCFPVGQPTWFELIDIMRC